MTAERAHAAPNILHGEVTGAVLKALYRVYDALGHGFLESVYCTALHHELMDAGLRVEREKLIKVWYRGRCVGRFRADLVVNECVIVESKASRYIDDSDKKQLMHYLRATTVKVGLLLHFGEKATFHRFFHDNALKPGLPVDLAQ